MAAGPHVHPSLFLFILFYGLDWVATVPPTVALCRQHFGAEKRQRRLRLGLRRRTWSAPVCAASFAGWVREWRGDYFGAWLTAGLLCVLAAGACLMIPRLREGVTAAR